MTLPILLQTFHQRLFLAINGNQISKPLNFAKSCPKSCKESNKNFPKCFSKSRRLDQNWKKQTVKKSGARGTGSEFDAHY